MQQTQTYKLNLIEPDDPFLPESLNANTRRLEQVVSQHLNGMDQRVATLESLKIAYGAYRGNGDYPRLISLPFSPRMVIIQPTFGTYSCAAFTVGGDITEGLAVKVAEGGFQLIYNHAYQSNRQDNIYCYIAMA